MADVLPTTAQLPEGWVAALTWLFQAPPYAPLTEEEFRLGAAWLAAPPDARGAAPPRLEAWQARQRADIEEARARLLKEKPPIRQLPRRRHATPAVDVAPTPGPTRCGFHDGPPCAPLYGDLPAVLLDHARWPTGICRTTLECSTAVWGRVCVEGSFTDAPVSWSNGIKRWSECWPLPVGRMALREALETDTELAMGLGDGAAWALLGSLPFARHEYAGLVLWAPLDPAHRPDDRLTVFVLADPQNLDAGLGELRWTAQGYTKIPDEMRRFVSLAKDFVTQFRGQPLSGTTLAGRKPGRRSRRFPQVQTTFWRLRKAREPRQRDPTQEEVAAAMATSVDTVGRLCRDYERETGLPGWPPPPYRPSKE